MSDPEAPEPVPGDGIDARPTSSSLHYKQNPSYSDGAVKGVPASGAPAEEYVRRGVGALRDWEEIFDESSGYCYYYNSVSDESIWDPPAGWPGVEGDGDGKMNDSNNNSDNATDPSAPSPSTHSDFDTSLFTATNQPLSPLHEDGGFDGSENNDGDDAKRERIDSSASDWIQCVDEQSRTYYYYNEKTGNSQWTEPASFRRASINIDSESSSSRRRSGMQDFDGIITDIGDSGNDQTETEAEMRDLLNKRCGIPCCCCPEPVAKKWKEKDGPKECPCTQCDDLPKPLKCCKKCCCCCKCCGNRYAQYLLLPFGIFMSFFLIWTVVVVFELLKYQYILAEPDYFKVFTVCDREKVPIQAKLMLDSPSFVSIELHELYVRAKLADRDEWMGSLYWSKESSGEKFGVFPGPNDLTFTSEFMLEDLESIGTGMVYTLNYTEFDGTAHVEFTISTDAYFIPIYISYGLDITMPLGTPLPGDGKPPIYIRPDYENGAGIPTFKSDDDAEKSDFDEDGNWINKSVTPPLIHDIYIDGYGKPEIDLGVQMWSNWTLFANNTPIDLIVPVDSEIYGEAWSDDPNMIVGYGRVDPFTLMPIAPMTMYYWTPYHYTSERMSALHRVFHKFVAMEDLVINIQGTDKKPANLTYCMAQEVGYILYSRNTHMCMLCFFRCVAGIPST